MTITLQYALAAPPVLDADTVAFDDLPIHDGPVLFDQFAADLGIELWPLPDRSHEAFLADRDHPGWITRLDDLHSLLHVVNLDHPWSLHPAGDLTVAACDLCDHQTLKSSSEQRVVKAIRKHLRTVHGWDR